MIIEKNANYKKDSIIIIFLKNMENGGIGEKLNRVYKPLKRNKS